MYELTISIVLYQNDSHELEPIINALLNSKLNLRLIVSDNSPTDFLRTYFDDPRIEYVFNSANLGYGAAHNIAIQKSICYGVKYHLVMNPDIYIEPAELIRLLHYFIQNEEIGLIMPLIRYPDGQTQYLCKLLASPIDLFGRRFIPFRKWIDDRNKKYELQFTGYNKIMQVPSLSGCFMLLRTDVLEKTGGFDERFFMYCEDFDLCRRIGKISKTIFYPKISVTHNYEKGSYKNSKLLRYHVISAIRYFNKWGWFFDKERKRINRETLLKLDYKK